MAADITLATAVTAITGGLPFFHDAGDFVLGVAPEKANGDCRLANDGGRGERGRGDEFRDELFVRNHCGLDVCFYWSINCLTRPSLFYDIDSANNG